MLNETFFTYLGGLNYFTDSDPQAKLTYADLKEHIGVDCPSTSTRRSTSAVYTPGTPPRMRRAACPVLR